MKTTINMRRANALVAFRALVASLMLTLPAPLAAEDAKKDNQGFLKKMEQWQDRMSEKFRDTWKKLRQDSKEKSVATAAVDLREDKDRYTLRLNLPDRDLKKVEIVLEGDTLRIVAPAGEKAGRYEQTLALAGVVAGAEPKIERKPQDSMIVVTVPKSGTSAEGKSASTPPDPALVPFSGWDREILGRMEKMRREMDRAFDDAFREFRSEPEHQGFFDEPRFGSSLDLKEEGDSYVIRAYLPDRDMQNINVTVEDRTLKIEAKEQEQAKKEDKAGVLHSTRKAAYSQLVTLPGPVQGDKMKVDKQEGMLVVTVPKAK
jgi:HSP20 family molecular chaperone IbpA